MHPLLSRQLSLFGPGAAEPDAGALCAAVDASYACYDEQLRSLQQQLDLGRRQLAQAGKMASLGQIAAGLAHEINNPVGYVCSNLELLQEHLQPLLQTDADLPQLVQESLDGMRRIRQIVQDLKEYSHGGGDTQEWEAADLHRGMDATLNMLRNELGHRADIVRDYGALPPVHCLPSQLNQVVMNLLVNAAHALGPRRGRITLRSGAGDGDVWFSVSDNGCGIAPDHLPRLFEPFFTTKPAGHGTGLGLSMVQDIVRRHGGRIDVSSELGRGTTFRVVLPQRQDATGRHKAA
ncbi:two-component histidine kinase [Janthinobacterium sp. HH01]|uniref:sensor histidine kinase n=1 Tax=Janthinobacterium sp. HH01 TaxID=1198452 RepID=UPI0002AE9070|nr:ATP-binding protein [Janthinobacterium sp. HH01]ELX11303.1 two-component histidine kinase [Janthinobacterium sp. HH01]